MHLKVKPQRNLLKRLPEFPFEAYHSHKNDVDTYYKWSPELTDVSASVSYKAVLSSKVACQHIEKVVREATCQEEGLVQVVCAVTGDVLGENVILKSRTILITMQNIVLTVAVLKTLTIKHL